MRVWKMGVFAVVIAAGCSSGRDGALTPDRAAVVDREVQAFAAMVAHDVTQGGPPAWRQYFSESPAFFMAADGRLQFPDGASAISGIQEVARTFKHIELEWSDVRVDPLTPELAGIGAGWHEVIDFADGKHGDFRGYFTGIAERRNGRWQFRNAHWSSAAAAPAAP